MAGRIRSEVRRGRGITLEFEGRSVEAYEGETIAAALLAADIRVFRRDRLGNGRGPWCGMGICYDCLVEIVGERESRVVRACMTPAANGMRIRVPKECE